MENVYYKILEKLLKADTGTEMVRRYENLKTDEERIVFILKIMQECDIVPSATGMLKNAKESEKWRKQGNNVYVKGAHNNETCMEVLKLFTKSIAVAPYPSEELALGYANRSAILFQLGVYSESIQDIDRALALNYPDNLRAKLYLRKAECLIKLGDSFVKNILEEVPHWLDKMSVNDKKREQLKVKLEVLQRKTVHMELHATNTKEKIAEPISTIGSYIESYNHEIPCASDAVALKYNEQYGRHVVATRDIHPGEMIAAEKPYSLLLAPENVHTYCTHCLSVCWANIPCSYCTYAMYCSEECRDIDWKKCHDMECAVLSVLIEYGMGIDDLFSIKLAVLALKEAGGIRELRSMLKEVDEYDDARTKGFSQDGKLHSDRYISMYSLVTDTEKRDFCDLCQRSTNATFILYLLATRTVIFGAKLAPDLIALTKNDDVTFFGGLILRHHQIISRSVHPYDEMQGLVCVQRGVAAMPFLSFLRHSCYPNILKYSRSDDVVIHAVRPIRKGEQLLDCYGEHGTITPRAVRQKLLREKYNFNCDCIPCREHWPYYREMESYRTLMKRKDKAKIRKILRKYDVRPEDLVTGGNVLDIEGSTIIEDLLKVTQILYDCTTKPCEEMGLCIMMLNLAYHLNGNVNLRFREDGRDELYVRVRVMLSSFIRD